MEVNEIDKKDYPNRIEALVKYLSQGLYGQEDVIKELLLFALAKRKVIIKADDEELKNIVLNRVYAAFKEFYVNKNFSIPCSGDTLKSIYIPKIQEEDFFDFITSDIPDLTPTEEQKSLLFSMDEVNAMQKEIKKIGLSDGVKRVILENRDRNHDTVWQDIVHVLQMSAFLIGRNKVCLADMSIFDFPLHNYINYVEYLKNEFKKNIITNGRIYKSFAGIKLINNKSIEEFHKFIIENFSKDAKEFSGIKNFKNTLDEKYYCIINYIEKRKLEIETFPEELKESNIFGNNENLSENFETDIKNLDETKTALESKYNEICFSFVKDIKIGDCIFIDGTHKKSSDIWAINTFSRDVNSKPRLNIAIQSLIAIICIKGNTADSLYGISQEGWTGIDFSETQKIAESYGAKGSTAYSSDWLIPTIEQLEEIYQNRGKIAQEALGYKLSGKFWSSTKKEDEAVYFFDFDKGTKDYTTPDHKYNLALVHHFEEY